MLDGKSMPVRNVISLSDARSMRKAKGAQPLRVRMCRHCGAALGDGENEDECSGAGFSAMAVPARRMAE